MVFEEAVVESWTEEPKVVATHEAVDSCEAFAWAAEQLLMGVHKVNIWNSGRGNVPTEVRRENYMAMKGVWCS